MQPRQPPFIAQTTIERRTVLRWLGNTTVLALDGELLSACLGRSIADRTGRDAGGAERVAEAGGAPGFAFAPGPGTEPIFKGWYENAVDWQNLVNILAGWTVTVDGMVSTPPSLQFSDLVALERQDQVTDFHCVEGWSVYDVPWNGVSLARLLDVAGAATSATHLTFHSVGERYAESLPIDVARAPHTLLGYGVSGSTLPLAHGFPVRVCSATRTPNTSRVSKSPMARSMGIGKPTGIPNSGEVSSSRLRPGKD
jgi:hypothetical protein